MSKNMFKVATSAAPACGATGARDVAFKAAAIEVIKNGGDRFIIVGDQSGSRFEGMTYNAYTGFQTYNSNQQNLVVRTLSHGDPNYANGLSARRALGSTWREIVANGAPNTCTES